MPQDDERPVQLLEDFERAIGDSTLFAQIEEFWKWCRYDALVTCVQDQTPG